jgi:hypothetical protein
MHHLAKANDAESATRSAGDCPSIPLTRIPLTTPVTPLCEAANSALEAHRTLFKFQISSFIPGSAFAKGQPDFKWHYFSNGTVKGNLKNRVIIKDAMSCINSPVKMKI